MERVDRPEVALENRAAAGQCAEANGTGVAANLAALENLANTTCASAKGRESRIECLIRLADQQAAETQALMDRIDDLIRPLQAYLRTIHPRQ